MPDQSEGAMEVFISYAHEDEKWRKMLQKWLVGLQRANYISIWYDREITAGKEFAREIDKHLDSAQIILLLISQDFINSDYCYSVEMERAMKRHEDGVARVIPIILSTADWKHLPISKLNALPQDAKPVNNWPDKSKAFLNINEGIRKAVEELRQMNVSEQLSNEMALLDVLIKHWRGIGVEKLKQETGLSATTFQEADERLLNLGYVRRGPTIRVISDEGRKFWSKQRQSKSS